MDKFLDREVAWRVLAHEFNRSSLHISEGDERAPNYIITPTGVKCNRLFIVGVVTEVENIGKDNNLWRARIADPTGVFTMYAGQYQPEAAIFLSELNIPAYVAVVGKARKFEPEDGSIYTSVRPEEINDADEKLRDRWILDTAERTLLRIRFIEDALSSGLHGNELKEYLLNKGTIGVLAEGAVKAIEHYKDLDKTIAELKNAVIHAIQTIASETETKVHIMEKEPQRKEVESESIEEDIGKLNSDLYKEKDPSRTDVTLVQEVSKPEPIEQEKEPKEAIAAIIDRMDKGKGTTYSAVVEAALQDGIDQEAVESGIKELMDEGRCYEPKIGVLRKV